MTKGKGGVRKLSQIPKKQQKKQQKKQVSAAVAAAVVSQQPSKKYRGDAGAAVIERCTCSSVFQDRLYGTGMRVKNKKRNGGTNCTVCPRPVRGK